MQIKPLSSLKDVNKNYKRLAKIIHLNNLGEERMKELNRAYEILKNYIENYKFTFSDEEIQKQYPEEFIKKFRV